MTTPGDRAAEWNGQEISRLVTRASREDRGDVYAGKRRLPRYATGMPFEAAFDKSDPAETVPVMMHNVSDIGLAFWAKRAIGPGTDVYLREFSDDKDCAWVGAHVTHCTPGIRGFLVGAEFHCPLEPDEVEPEEQELAAVGEHSPAPVHPPSESPSKRRGLLSWIGWGREDD